MGSNDSTAKEQSFLFNVNKIFLVIHLLMLVMFSSLGVDLMAGVNLISICFYFLAFSLTKSEKLSIYVYSVAVEILLHMILAVVCLGIQCNFQLFLIDAMFFLFAMDYVVLRKKKKNHVAILLCCVYAIALIILYMFDGFYTPLYKLDSVVIKSISIAMISGVVFLIIICMMCLLHFMSSEEGAMEKQAQFDALTELPNRFYMMAKLKNLFEAEKQGEYYLTDVLAKLNAMGKKVGGVATADSDMIMGINSRRQLAEAENIMRQRILNKLMDDGVTIMDPASTFIEKGVEIGQDTVIYPYTWLEGTTKIGEDCQIGPNVRLTNVRIGNTAELQFVYGHDCEVQDNVVIGPYVHLRPDTVIGDNVKIGNFVEVKNSHVGTGSKLPHLSYIGDSDIGSSVNIGCGCITVNYDGKKKHRTIIEDNAFVGCNSNMVAPVTIGAGAYIGAGSTITKDVPEDDLGIARAKQKNIEGWAAKYRNG